MRPTLAGVAILLGAVGLTSAQARQPVTLQVLERLSVQPHVTIQLSPDGRYLVAGLNEEVKIIDVHSKQVLHEVGPGFLPTWAPNGASVAFYSTRSGDVQIWIWDRNTNATTQLTNFPEGIDPNPTTSVFARFRDAFQMSWAPDSSRIAFASRVPFAKHSDLREVQRNREKLPSQIGPLVLTNSTPPEETLAGIFAQPSTVGGIPELRDGRRVSFRSGGDSFGQVFVVDREAGETTQLTRGNATRFHPSWSPNGSAIVYAAIDQMKITADANQTQIAVVDVTSGNENFLTAGSGVKSFPQWSPDGSRISYIQSATTYADNQIYVISREPEASPDSRFDLDRYTWQYQWSHSGDGFLIVYNDGVSRPLARVGLASGNLMDVSKPGRTAVCVNTFTQSLSGAIAWGQFDPANLWTIQYLQPGQARSETLLRLWPQADALALGKPEVITWRNGRGERKEGTLLLPPDARREPHPVIVDAYPLLSGCDWSSPMLSNHAWASMGYAVFRPSPRAPHVWKARWKSNASSLPGGGPSGWNVTFDDVMSGIDELARRGIIDPDRMCLYGHSNGGTVVNYMVTRTHRFRCAVSVAPALTNWVRPILLGQNPNQLIHLNGNRSFDNDLDSYIALSPVFQVSSVETPMLLAAGDSDGDFLLNAIEMYNGLRRLGKDVTLVRYPNEGHVFSGDALKDFWEREMAFFGRHLMTAREPRDTSVR